MRLDQSVFDRSKFTQDIKPGDRVRLIHTSDPYTHQKPGDEGTVSLVDAIGTVHVKWDDGGSLGLIYGEDRWTTA